MCRKVAAGSHGGGFHEHGAFIHRDECTGFRAVIVRTHDHSAFSRGNLGNAAKSTGCIWLLITTASATKSRWYLMSLPTLMRVKVPGGFHLRNSAGEREWLTASGKANFYAHPVPTDQ
jgi:hypothetical protein